MPKKISKKHIFPITVVILGCLAMGAAILVAYFNQNNAPKAVTSEEPSVNISKEAAETPESYKGTSTVVAKAFSVKVPNGWRVSVSDNSRFLAIMFARPNQLESLIYNASNAPTIDYNGIPSWNGLTEHFFIIMPTTSQAFSPENHREVSSQPFTFNDGTVGQYYYVVKHADEAQKWGGLQKDTEWQGRTYIYEKNGKKVEAHLAVYPSTNISVPFYEDVIRTLQF